MYNLNISKSIGFIHLFGMIIQNTYGFIIPKYYFFDKLYLITFLSIPFSWILFKNECLISYLTKKLENPNYILGSNPDDVKDVSLLFKTKEQYMIFYNFNTFVRIYSVIIVNERTTNISYFIFIPTCILYLYYSFDIAYKLNNTKRFYPYFQIILCSYLSVMLYSIL